MPPTRQAEAQRGKVRNLLQFFCQLSSGKLRYIGSPQALLLATPKVIAIVPDGDPLHRSNRTPLSLYCLHGKSPEKAIYIMYIYIYIFFFPQNFKVYHHLPHTNSSFWRVPRYHRMFNTPIQYIMLLAVYPILYPQDIPIMVDSRPSLHLLLSVVLYQLLVTYVPNISISYPTNSDPH